MRSRYLSRWFGFLRGAARDRRGRQPRPIRFRPIIESLELREVPSSSTWIGGGFDNICTGHRPMGSDPNAWSNPLNWQGGVPAAGDAAVFPAPFQIATCGGNPVFAPFSTTANVDRAFTIASLSTAAAWNSNVNVNNPLTISNGLTLASGDLGGDGAMSVAGASQWTGGVLSLGTGGLTNHGTLTLANASQVFLNGNGTLTNMGTIIQSGAGGLNIQSTIASATTILNQSGATYNFRADSSIFSTSGGGTVTNAGTLQKTVTGGTSAIQVVFNNSGTIDVETGTIKLQTSGGVNTGGIFTVAGSAVLDLTGGNTVTYKGSYTGSGAGTVSLNSGDLVMGSGGATFNFPAGLFQWSGGILTVGAGNLTNASTGVLTLSNAGSTNDFLNGNGTLVNGGTIIQSGTGGLNLQSTVSSATTVNNQASGVYNIGVDASIFSTSGGGTLVNAGILRKSAGTGTSLIQVVLNSSAAIDVRSGILKLQTSGGTDTGGTFTVAAGATLDLTGTSTVTYQGTYTGSGGGTVALKTGDLVIGDATTFNFPAGLFQWSGGILTVPRGIQLVNANILTLSNVSPTNDFLNGNGTLVNGGTIIQSGTGGLNLQSTIGNATTVLNQNGATYSFQADSGIFSSSGGGTFTNLGTILKTVTAGTSAVSVAFNTSAAIDVETGTFQITDTPGSNTGGNFTVARNAVLDLTGGTSVTYSGSYTGSGAGTVALRSGDLVVGTGGATFNFPAGLFQWSGGIITVPSMVQLTNTGTLTLSNTGSTNDFLNGNGTLVNGGTIIQSGTGGLNLQSTVGNATTLRNQSGATYNFAADGSIVSTSGGGTVTNLGTILKSAGTTASAIAVVLNNSAAITVQAATLKLQTTGGVNTGGTFTVAGGATLDLTGGSTVVYQGTYTGSGAGTVALSTGTLAVGSAGATFNFPAGLFQWRGGFINTSAGNLTNAATGVLTLSNPSPTNDFLNGNGMLVNAGTIIQADVGGLNLQSTTASATTLLNQAGATYNFQADGSIFSTSGNGTVTNVGTILKTVTAGTSLIQTVLNNSGVIDVETGTVALATTGGVNTGGNFITGAGATLDLTGGSSVTYTGTYTGSGTGTVALNNGTLSVGTGGATFNFPAGLFQWGGGVINTSAGNLTNAATGAITLVNSGFAFLNGNGSLINAGTITQAGTGDLNLQSSVGNATTLNNQAGALYDIQTDANILSTSGGGTVLNSGTVQKSGGTATSAIDVLFSNPGTVLALASTLAIDSDTTEVSGNTLTAGTWQVFNAATLTLNRGVNLTTSNATVVLDGPGSTFTNLVNLAVNGGMLTIQDGGSFTTAGDLANFGYLLIDATSVLNVSGNYTQDAAATLEIQLGGSGGPSGQLNVAGTAFLDGTLVLTPVNGYVPSTGDSFAILTYGARNGDFANPPAGFNDVFDDVNGIMTVVAQ
jgi:hypothetical protein